MQIDQVTQQNASLVNEAAMASRVLEEQGRELNEVVSFFRLPGEGGGCAVPGAAVAARRQAGSLATA